MLNESSLNYFNNGLSEINKLWLRIAKISKNNEPQTFKDCDVLELGCGHGRLTIELAKQGTRSVTGVDLDKHLIDSAQENLNKNFSELKEIVDFKLENICNLDSDMFDCIVSKDTFEHIIELEEVLNCMYRGHVILPDGYLIKNYNKINSSKKINHIYDLGLNKLKLKEYLNLFEKSDFEILYLESNVTEHWIGKVQNILKHIPFLKEYFSFNIYCVLQKK